MPVPEETYFRMSAVPCRKDGNGFRMFQKFDQAAGTEALTPSAGRPWFFTTWLPAPCAPAGLKQARQRFRQPERCSWAGHKTKRISLQFYGSWQLAHGSFPGVSVFVDYNNNGDHHGAVLGLQTGKI